MTQTLRELKAQAWWASRFILRWKDVWLRALICLGLGFAFVFLDRTDNYDTRFSIRGSQAPSTPIVLLTFDESDWSRLHQEAHLGLGPWRNFSATHDGFFWHDKTWPKLLQKILDQDALGIGITYFFGQNSIPRPDDLIKQHPVLVDSRILWSAKIDNDGRALLPAFSNDYGSNIALFDLRPDEDRVVRRFSSPSAHIPHMSFRLAEITKQKRLRTEEFTGARRIINFQGQNPLFPSVSVSDLIDERLPADFFKGKIVIIGSRSNENHIFSTPLGQMNRSEIIAQVTENIAANKWVKRTPYPVIVLILIAILALTLGILFSYPQSVAFVFLFWMAISWTAFSFWIFDTFYFWIPILSPVAQILVTYMIFLGYQLTQKENLSWRLQEEKRFLLEIEQLKNNFVSLFSHDLKTPIAKIQAICDRLLAQNVDAQVQEGLNALRKESMELHRYIQSILQISRVESRDFKINKEAGDINELVERVVEQLSPLADAKNIKIHTELEPMFLIDIDSILIFEVVLNLVENAIKYAPGGSAIQITTEEIDDMVVLVVEDNGAGISTSEQDKIFEKFYRGEAHNMSTKGSGLGLFLVKYFIELHGGKVFLFSEEGKGTRVGFRLPVSEASAALNPSTTQQALDSGSTNQNLPDRAQGEVYESHL